jgi:predicted RNase H-like HicB family nuclease
MTTYTVQAERSGGWWALEVPELPGVFSQTRRLDQAELTARDAIGAMLDVDPESFEVQLVTVFDEETNGALNELATARDYLDRANRWASAALRRAVHMLTRRDQLTVRDAGKVLGLSYQRVAQVQQLLAANEDAKADDGAYAYLAPWSMAQGFDWEDQAKPRADNPDAASAMNKTVTITLLDILRPAPSRTVEAPLGQAA